MSQNIMNEIEKIKGAERNRFEKIMNKRLNKQAGGHHMFEVTTETRVPAAEPMAGIKNEFGTSGGPLKQNGTCLLEAYGLVNGDRQGYYGDPKESFDRIALLWTAYLDTKITAGDVAVCMALLKIGREAFEHGHDNMVDAAGYIGLACDLAEMGGE